MSASTVVLKTTGFKSYFNYLSQVFAIVTAFVLPLTTAALEVFLIATVIFSLFAGGWREKYTILRTNPVALMFIVFFSLSVIGISYTSASQIEVLNSLLKYSKFLFGFFLFSVFLDEQTARYAIVAFLLAAILTLLLSFVKFFAGWDILHRFGSDSGIFKDHIFTGFLLAFASYCYGLLAFSRNDWRWVFALLFFLSAVNVLFINVGRSGYLVFFSLLFLLAWQQWRWKGLAIVFLLASFLLASLFLFKNNFRSSFLVTQSEIHKYDIGTINTSGGLRLSFYKNSLKLLRQHPWLGTGTGSFTQVYSQQVGDHYVDTHNPHNEYLNSGVQFGALGILVLLSLFCVHWYESFHLAPMRKKFAQAVLVSIAVGSLFNSWLMDVTQGCFYIFFTALVFSRLSIPLIPEEADLLSTERAVSRSYSVAQAKHAQRYSRGEACVSS
jgi:O-antigen ligase